MSYARMDHAAWVESNNAAMRRTTRRPARPGSGGRAASVGPHGAPEKLSEFQAKVMDILGMVFGGIYNAPIAWTTGVDWNYGRGVSVTLQRASNPLSTFDSHQLTTLVFLCHEARIRCEIEARSFGALRLNFWHRRNAGGFAERHPNLDEAIAAFRAWLPADHRIVYRAPEADPTTSATPEVDPANQDAPPQVHGVAP